MAPPVGSVEVADAPDIKGEGKPRRYWATPDKLIDKPHSTTITTLAGILEESVKKYPNEKAMGWRELVQMHVEVKEVTKMVGGEEVKEKKKWSYFEMSSYKFWTYAELADQVKLAASGLVKLGHSKDTIFNIYASTGRHWQVMANACASQSITFATAYDSLGEDGLRHSITQPSVYGVFTNATLLSTLANVIDKCPTVKVIVYEGKQEDVKKGVLEKLKSANDGIKIVTLEELIALGKETPVEPHYPQPEDIACIMYTSGSTGDPKGVLLSNANVVAIIGGLEVMLGDILDRKFDSFLAYLPLAHIFEMAVEICMIFLGIPLGYGGVKTLTDTSMRNCAGDIREFKPTILIGVPAVWETIRKGILGKVRAGGSIKSAIFHGAFRLKKAFGRNSYVGHILDALVFKAVREATGGRLRYGVSGGAPLSRQTQEFITNALVLQITGFGMTESCALSAVLHPDYFSYGPVGVPVPCCEIKLVDFADAGYYSHNESPQGEIWIRGPSISKGYYKLDDVTKENFTDDGWLKTGDIGQWNEDGTLSIIDRKKNLIKLSGGEYVAVERLESVYKSCNVVSHICIHASSDASRPMAIVTPNEPNLKHMIAEKKVAGAEHEDLAELCANKNVRKAVLDEMNAVGKKAGLKQLETLQTLVMTAEEWTPENFLTAAQKLQRKAILSTFKKEIDAVYP